MSTTTEPLHAARLSLDTDTDPSVIVTAAKRTIHDGDFAARLTDSLACGGVIVTGAPGCIIEGQPAARVTDAISHGSVVMTGTSKVVIGNLGGGVAHNGVAIAPGISLTKESYFKNLANAYEQSDGGHSVDRHGPDVTPAQLEHRLRTGVAPDNKFSPAPASTQFTNYEIWVKTRQIALEEWAKFNQVNLHQPPQPGILDLVQPIIIEFDRPIDDGLIGNPLTKFNLVNPFTHQQTNRKGYTGLFPVSGITRTKTMVDWDATKSKWIVVQHFPSTQGWDNNAKTYDQPPDVYAVLQ